MIESTVNNSRIYFPLFNWPNFPENKDTFVVHWQGIKLWTKNLAVDNIKNFYWDSMFPLLYSSTSVKLPVKYVEKNRKSLKIVAFLDHEVLQHSWIPNVTSQIRVGVADVLGVSILLLFAILRMSNNTYWNNSDTLSTDRIVFIDWLVKILEDSETPLERLC